MSHVFTILRVVIFVCFGLLLTDLLLLLTTGASRNIGGYTGMVLSVLFMLYALFAPKFHVFVSNTLKAGGARKGVLIGVIVFCSLILLSAIVETTCMLVFMEKDTPKSADGKPPVVVVLGCQVRNGRASLMLDRRIDAAYDYLVKNPECFCIACGGQGDDEAMSEAQCIYEGLVARGIDPSRILLEDKSTTTRENLSFAKTIMAEHDLGSTVVLVTSDFHAFRAQLIAGSLDLPCGAHSGKTDLWLLPPNYFRELYAILYQLVF